MTDGRDRERIDRQGWSFLGGGLLLVAAAAGYFLIAALVQPSVPAGRAATVAPQAGR